MNPRTTLTIVIAALLAALAPSTARADVPPGAEESPPAQVRVQATPRLPVTPWSVELNLGDGTPGGPLTLSRDFRLADFVGARVTLGMANLTLMPYLRAPLSARTDVRLSAGVTAGFTHWGEGPFCFSDDCASKRSWNTVFGNAEVSVVHRLSAHIHVKPYVGYSAALNPSTFQCAGDEPALGHCELDHAKDGLRRVYGGVSVGLSW